MDELTSAQISEWEAYDRLDPIGTWREDYRMAYLAMTMTNLAIAIHGKKGAKQVTVQEFMPNFSGEEAVTAVQTIDEMKVAMQHIADAFKKKSANQADPKRKPKKLADNG